jgi:hypothetical protein
MTRLKKKYLKKQKLMGFLLIFAVVIVTLLTGGDATVGLLFIPLGLWFIITKKVYLGRYEYIEEMKERRRQWRLR